MALEMSMEQYTKLIDEYVEFIDEYLPAGLNTRHITEILIKSIDLSYQEKKDVIGWQKCPKCDGQGFVSKPPWVAGDQYEWSDSSTSHVCNVCNGMKIIRR